MKLTYLYIWEYFVKTDFISQFKKLYGDEGKWVILFKQSPGYLKTELFQDKNNPNRFLTIDYWKSKNDYELMKKKFGKKINEIDKIGENYTSQEKFLGEFNKSSN